MKDLARIYVKAGDGGDGSVHFRTEKFAPKGGPDGGDGGRGGDVVLIADENVDNLVEFNYRRNYEAKDGEQGYGKKMHGKDREQLVVHVPVGTTVSQIPKELYEINLRERANFEKLMSERELVVDMDQHGKSFIVAYGGRGGRGNDHFKSATNQTPREAEQGAPGEEKHLVLEHKVVADIGLLGLPNVGKSSLLKTLTRANPRIAGYPFTTLEPNLGVLKLNERNMVIVDVPGVVEDAWEGRGIGPWFLRHLERVTTLVHVLAPDLERGSDYLAQMLADYRVVRSELTKYGKGLPDKREIVVINKSELLRDEEKVEVEKGMKREGLEVVFVSAASGLTQELKRVLIQLSN